MTIEKQKVVSVTVPVTGVSYDKGEDATRVSFDGGELVLKTDRRAFLQARRIEAKSKRCGSFAIVLLENLRKRK